jgi:hypothetical protein
VPGLRPTRIPRDDNDCGRNLAPQVVERPLRGLELAEQATNRIPDRRDAHDHFGEEGTPG